MLKNRYYSHLRKVLKEKEVDLINDNKIILSKLLSLSEKNENVDTDRFLTFEKESEDFIKERRIELKRKIHEINELIDKILINNLKYYDFCFDKGNYNMEKGETNSDPSQSKLFNINVEIVKISQDMIKGKLKRLEIQKSENLNEIFDHFLNQSDTYLKLIELTREKLIVHSLPPVPM